MKELTGVDLWEVPADLRVITTNGKIRKDGRAVMGRGCARQARDRFEGVDLRLGRLLGRHGNRPFRLGRLPDGSVLASLPVKHSWEEEADLKLVHGSLELLVELADKWGHERVVPPRPGCGNGGHHWPTVRRAVSRLLDDRFTVVHGGREPEGKVSFVRPLWAVVLDGVPVAARARHVLNVFASKGFAEGRVEDLKAGLVGIGVAPRSAQARLRVEPVSDALGEVPFGEEVPRAERGRRAWRSGRPGRLGA